MAKVGLSKAAELSGKSASTIHRAMRKGRLSYETDEHGTRLVDTAELARVFGVQADAIAGDNVHALPRTSQVQPHASAADIVQLRADLSVERLKGTMLEERMRELSDRVDDLRRERDEWRQQAQTLLLASRVEPAINDDPAEDGCVDGSSNDKTRRTRWWRWALFLF